MPYQALDYGDEGSPIPWGVSELGREAHCWEGIIITLDGDRWNIPHGGGVVRTSSAIAMSAWLPEWDPREQGILTRIAHHYLMPAITDTIYRESPIMRFLKNVNMEHLKPPTMPGELMYAHHLGPEWMPGG